MFAPRRPMRGDGRSPVRTQAEAVSTKSSVEDRPLPGGPPPVTRNVYSPKYKCNTFNIIFPLAPKLSKTSNAMSGIYLGSFIINEVAAAMVPSPIL